MLRAVLFVLLCCSPVYAVSLPPGVVFEFKEEIFTPKAEMYLYSVNTAGGSRLATCLPELFVSMQTFGAHQTPSLSNFTNSLFNGEAFSVNVNGNTMPGPLHTSPDLTGQRITHYEVEVLYWNEEESRPGEITENYGVILRGLNSTGVPEPASGLLCLLGLMAMPLRWRRAPR